MRVVSPAMSLNVDLRDLETKDGKLVFNGFANTMPCQVLVSQEEIWPVIRLLLDWRVVKMVMKALFKQGGKEQEPG